MAITAPYNFVPLSRFVYFPEWHAAVSHDLPFDDGVSGVLSFTVTARTPMLVGGDRKRGDHTVHPFLLPDGRYAIPGSSLNGMIRSVIEIAAFGKFIRVDDRRLGVRDLSSGATLFYRDRPALACRLAEVRGEPLAADALPVCACRSSPSGGAERRRYTVGKARVGGNAMPRVGNRGSVAGANGVGRDANPGRCGRGCGCFGEGLVSAAGRLPAKKRRAGVHRQYRCRRSDSKTEGVLLF